MKNSLVSSLFLISTLLLSGCGDSKEDTQAIPEGMASDPKQDATVEQPANVEEQIKDLPYNKFKLAIYTKENKDATVLAEFDKKTVKPRLYIVMIMLLPILRETLHLLFYSPFSSSFS